MKVETAIKRREFPAEDTFYESLAGEHLSRRFQECIEQIELRRCEVQKFAGPQDRASRSI